MHILHFGYNSKQLILSKMTCIHESLYIQYSISDDIVMIHNFASNIIIIAQDM